MLTTSTLFLSLHRGDVEGGTCFEDARLSSSSAADPKRQPSKRAAAPSLKRNKASTPSVPSSTSAASTTSPSRTTVVEAFSDELAAQLGDFLFSYGRRDSLPVKGYLRCVEADVAALMASCSSTGPGQPLTEALTGAPASASEESGPRVPRILEDKEQVVAFLSQHPPGEGGMTDPTAWRIFCKFAGLNFKALSKGEVVEAQPAAPTSGKPPVPKVVPSRGARLGAARRGPESLGEEEVSQSASVGKMVIDGEECRAADAVGQEEEESGKKKKVKLGKQVQAAYREWLRENRPSLSEETRSHFSTLVAETFVKAVKDMDAAGEGPFKTLDKVGGGMLCRVGPGSWACGRLALRPYRDCMGAASGCGCPAAYS